MTSVTTGFKPYSSLFRPLLWLGVAGLISAVVAISASASDDSGRLAIAGEAPGAISGFIVSDIHYSLADDNPGRLAGVELSIVSADGHSTPSRVVVSVQAGTPPTSCLPTFGTRWTCPLDAPLASADSLRVSASG